MHSGSPRNLLMSSWPPGAQLLNFPQPSEPQCPRLASVHFQSPPDRILNLRPRRLGLNPDNAGAAGQPPDPEDDRNLARKFMRFCYLVAGIYSLVAAVQMLIMAGLLRPDVDFMFPGFVCILMSLVVLLMFTILSRLRKILWLSFTLSALFVELVCAGVTLVLVNRTLLSVGVALLAACCLLIVCYVIGAWLPKVLLPGERFMLIFVVIFAVASMFIITMHIFTNKLVYATVYFGLLLVMLIPASIYHAQVVHSRRIKMPIYEYVLAGTFVYLHFLLFFSGIYFCIWVSSTTLSRINKIN